MIKKPQTVIVAGLAKTGTSMVAGSVRMLGVMMGKDMGKWGDYTEDMEIASCFSTESFSLFEKYVEERNAEFPVWGFKHPDLIPHLEYIEKHVRRPKFICVFRDPYAIALHRVQNNFSVNGDLHHQRGHSMIRVMNETIPLARFVLRRKANVLPISYEKALMFPERFAQELVDFLGATDCQDAIDAIVDYVKPEAKYPSIAPYLERAGVDEKG